MFSVNHKNVVARVVLVKRLQNMTNLLLDNSSQSFVTTNQDALRQSGSVLDAKGKGEINW